MKTEIFSAKDIVYTYTSNQAVEDGILFDLDQGSENEVLRPVNELVGKFTLFCLVQKEVFPQFLI
jgi:hypothetical protein